MLRRFFVKVQAYLAIKAKIAEARSEFKKDGIRRFVIPFNDGDMQVLTKAEALAMKKNGQLARDLTAKTIYGACFFFTNTTATHEHVKCEMPKKELNRRMEFYYRWFSAHHTNCV